MEFALSGGTATDFYKPGHGKLYPFGTTRKYSNFTPRSAKNFLASKSCSSMYDNKVVNFGLYGTWQELVELWDRTFFNVSKKKAIKAIKRRFDNACGLDVISVDQIAALHDIGFLPLTVLAIEEGARVNIGVPLWTVFNSEEYPDQYWLVNYLETITSAYNWKSICNATIAFEYRRICEKWAALTCDNKDHVKFQCHDFSFRGMSGPEDAMRSGAAHLTSFVGTDTIPAIDYLEKHYNANSDLELLGASVTATEHAVATANILTRLRAKLDMIAAEGKSISHETIDELKTECEREYILEIILEKVKTGIISLVCDSFDFWAIISKVLPSIRKEIESRIKNELGLAKVVVRPDSGNPVLVICGYRIAGEHADLAAFDAYLHNNGTVDGLDGEVVKVGDNWHVIRNRFASGFVEATDYLGEIITEAEVRGAVESLWGSFGGTVNAKGYKVLNEYIGLIYGDSITVHRCEEIFERLEAKGFASSNIVLGVGSFTYQYSTRDTFGMAMKATACEVMNQLIELYKDPKTASSKKSAKGFLRVVKEGDNYVTQQEVDMNWGDLENGSGELKPLWKNGTFKRHVRIASVRNKLDAEFA